jgi:hypothetical protein
MSTSRIATGLLDPGTRISLDPIVYALRQGSSPVTATGLGLTHPQDELTDGTGHRTSAKSRIFFGRLPREQPALNFPHELEFPMYGHRVEVLLGYEQEGQCSRSTRKTGPFCCGVDADPTVPI